MSDSVQASSFRNPSTIGTIWRLCGDQQPVLVRSIGYKTLQAAFEALPAAALVYVINALRAGELTGQAVWIAALAVFVCVIAQWGAGYLANRSAWIATFELFGALRARMLNHVRRLPMGFFDQHSTGEIVTVMTQDVSTVESFTHEPLQMMIGAAVAPIVVFLVLSTQDLPMAAATVVSVIGALPTFLWTNRVFTRLAAERAVRQADAAGRMIEYVQGLPVIRAFGLAGDKLGVFRTSLADFRDSNMTMARKLAPLSSLFLSVVFLGVPLVLFAGTYWYLGGRLDPALFLIFAVLVLRVYLPLIAATQGFESLRMADASLDRIAVLMDRPAEAAPSTGADLPQTHEIEFRTVAFAYEGDQHVVEDLSFVARPGTVTALVGPSGAGKSTVLQLIAGLRRPSAGTIAIGGMDTSALRASDLFDLVTPVFQDVYLFSGTIFDNIAFGREHAAPEAVVRAAKLAQAHEFIERLPEGYASTVDEAGVSLSGGERQRIAIARAILKDAPIVLLDEMTSALDATNELKVQQAIAALTADKTVLVIAHRLGTIRHADQILVLERGRIVQQGTHEALLQTGGLYGRLWQAREAAAQWRIR
ncbi:MAG: ABC transporter ATP-binding protein [Pseudomonadota bacterium]